MRYNIDMTYRWIENIPAEQLDAFVESCGNGSVLQESRWAKVKENWESYFVGVSDGKQIVATAMILSRTLVRPFTLFYIPRGPIMDFENHELVEFFFAALKKFAKKKHAVYVKFDPLIVHSVHQPGDEVVICGIASEYCVFESLKNLCALSQAVGFSVKVFLEGTAKFENYDAICAFMAENDIPVWKAE